MYSAKNVVANPASTSGPCFFLPSLSGKWPLTLNPRPVCCSLPEKNDEVRSTEEVSPRDTKFTETSSFNLVASDLYLEG